MAPPTPSLAPMDENHFAEILNSEFTPLNINGNDNPYFDYPQIFTRYSRASEEITPIDLSLATMMDPPMPSTSGQAVITVPEHLAEATSKALIYLAQIVNTPRVPKDVDESPAGEVTLNTAEEIEALEPIVEEPPGPLTPNIIDGVCVNKNPTSIESFATITNTPDVDYVFDFH
jgi:hypothetical protein